MPDIKTHATLTHNLVSYWDLDEESGIRYDSHGENNLTDNNTVGSAIGLGERRCAVFNADNSENLSLKLMGSELFTISLDFSYSQWFRLDNASLGAHLFVATQDALSVAMVVRYNGNGSITCFWKRALGSGNEVRHINVTLQSNKFYFIAVTLDVSMGQLKVLIKDTDDNTVLDGTSEGNNGFYYSSHINQRLSIFSNADRYGVFQNFASGRSQNIGVWKNKILTASEKDDLYNNGVPLPYDASTNTCSCIIGQMMMKVNGL